MFSDPIRHGGNEWDESESGPHVGRSYDSRQYVGHGRTPQSKKRKKKHKVTYIHTVYTFFATLEGLQGSWPEPHLLLQGRSTLRSRVFVFSLRTAYAPLRRPRGAPQRRPTESFAQRSGHSRNGVPCHARWPVRHLIRGHSAAPGPHSAILVRCRRRVLRSSWFRPARPCLHTTSGRSGCAGLPEMIRHRLWHCDIDSKGWDGYTRSCAGRRTSLPSRRPKRKNTHAHTYTTRSPTYTPQPTLPTPAGLVKIILTLFPKFVCSVLRSEHCVRLMSLV